VGVNVSLRTGARLSAERLAVFITFIDFEKIKFLHLPHCFAVSANPFPLD
jgi:hypothetical protein